MVTKKKQTFEKRYIRIKSRHPSHHPLRKRYGNGILLPELAVVRFGSTTKSKVKIQINSIEAIENSSSKFKMKECFKKAGVQSPDFWRNHQNIPEDAYPIVAKINYGSRGNGMYKLDSPLAKQAFVTNRDLSRYYFEKFYTHTREYRLHVTEMGCFYTCRKMLKQNTPEDKKWYRNNDNCIWYLESNPSFNKPDSWDNIVAECIKAMKSVGLDFAACDVKVNKKGNFQILEVNSAPSFGEETEAQYRKIIPQLFEKKRQELK